MAKRLRRKEIKKQDELISTFENVLEYLQSNWKMIAAAAGAAIVVVGLVYLWHWNALRNERKAALLLTEALELYHAEVSPEGKPEGLPDDSAWFKTAEEKLSSTSEKLETVLNSHKGTRTASYAEFYKALAMVETDRKDEAAALFASIAAREEDTLLASLAVLCRIRLMEMQGKWDDAATEYERILNVQNRFLPHDLLLLNRGVALEKLSRFQEAAAAYRKLIDEFPQSPYKADAERAENILRETHDLEEAPAGPDESDLPMEEAEPDSLGDTP